MGSDGNSDWPEAIVLISVIALLALMVTLAKELIVLMVSTGTLTS